MTYLNPYSLCVYCGEDISFSQWLLSHRYGECKSSFKRKGVNYGSPHIYSRGEDSTLSIASG